jgi:hypothetical protein
VALLLALVSILVLTCLVQWSLLHALSGIRRVDAQRRVLHRALARESARATLSALLDTTPLGSLASVLVPLVGDTTVRVTPLPDGWVRVGVLAAGHEFMAELARVVPWSWPCAAATVSAAPNAPPGAIRADTDGPCVAVHITSRAVVDSLVAAWERGIVSRPLIDTLILSATASDSPRLYRARDAIHITGGAVVRGLLWAPVIHVAASARVEGSLLAMERLEVSAGGSVVADAGAVMEAWSTVVRVHRLGRRGVLTFP